MFGRGHLQLPLGSFNPYLLNLLSRIYNKTANKIAKVALSFEAISYAQEGEDLILKRFFEDEKTGFYVDVGAHHPKRFSNSYLFYRQGWHGINIDAMPGSSRAFEKMRPRDCNLELAVSLREGPRKFYIFDEPALNTFDPSLIPSRLGRGYSIIDEKIVTTATLSNILEKYCPPSQTINFLSVDVEGLDLEALKSNDWKRFRPQLVLTECLSTSLDDAQKGELYEFMVGLNYKLFAKTLNTFFFADALLPRFRSSHS